ncbi:non-ribosomal peptide synthetase, partial [Marinicrinis sediminis]
DYPYEQLIERLKIKRDLGRNPLFDTMFAMQNMAQSELDLGSLKLSDVPAERQVSKFDLSLTVTLEGDGMRLDVEYATALFQRETAARLAQHYVQVLRHIVAQPAQRLQHIELLTEQERHEIMHVFNANKALDIAWDAEKADEAWTRTILERFEQQAERTPHATAVVDDAQQGQLTYQALNARANQLAHRLREGGIKASHIVAIMLEPSLDMVIAVLAVWKAGASYLPIDHAYPTQRIQYMLGDSQAELLITSSRLRSSVQAHCHLLEIDVCEVGHYADTNLPDKPEPNELAYLIYTSGSTGEPKGVMIEHHALSNMCNWYQSYYELTSEDRCSKYAGFGFDASVWEIFPCLISGASLYIVPESQRLNVEALNAYMNEKSITVSFLPTAVCESFIQLHNESLRVLLTGGDKLKTCQPQRYKIVNNYGPTENTVVTTACEVKPPYTSIPIGAPISNVDIYILNQVNQLQPVGVAGELCIAGRSLASGYWNKPDKTAEAFVDHPFIPGEKMYRTGDLARWLPNGQVEYLGRIDQQVSIRGARVEVGEVEANLLRLDGISEAVVLAVDVRDETQLCAYLVSEGASKPNMTWLKEQLRMKLPAFMLPSHYTWLEAIPLTANGKVDRKLLPHPEPDSHARVIVAPRNDTEQRLVELYRIVLKLEPVSVDDDFFELGGHSLKASMLAANVMKEFRVELTLRELFQFPVLEQQARLIQEKGRVSGSSPLVSIPPAAPAVTYPVSSAQKRMLLVQQLEEFGTAYNMPFALRLQGELDRPRLREAFQQLVKRHEAFRTEFV